MFDVVKSMELPYIKSIIPNIKIERNDSPEPMNTIKISQCVQSNISNPELMSPPIEYPINIINNPPHSATKLKIRLKNSQSVQSNISDLDLTCPPVVHAKNSINDPSQSVNKLKLKPIPLKNQPNIATNSSISTMSENITQVINLQQGKLIPDTNKNFKLTLREEFKSYQPYHCIKLPLKNLLYKNVQSNMINNNILNGLDSQSITHIINDATIRTNKIIIKTYLLLKLWILFKYEQKSEDLIPNRETIKMAIQVVCSEKNSPRKIKQKKYETASDRIKDQLKNQRFQELQHINPFNSPEDNKYLSGILDQQVTSIQVSIENNIKLHFCTHFKTYVKHMLSPPQNDPPLNKEDRKKLKSDSPLNKEDRKKLKNDMWKVGTDLLKNVSPEKYRSDPKYHKWINEQKEMMLPLIKNHSDDDTQNSHYYNVCLHPEDYMKYMIKINQEFLKTNHKLFQFCPIRTSLIPKCIQLDTKALIELLIESQSGWFLAHIEESCECVWKTFFNIKIKNKDYSFDHAIVTDGVSASIRLIHVRELDKVKIFKTNQKIGREKARERRKLGIDSRETECKSKSKSKLKSDVPEFLYIDEVPDSLLKGNHGYSDNGKKNLMALINDRNQTMNYTNQQRLHETKQLKYQRLMYNYRLQQGIIMIEQDLSDYNAKSCDFQSFLQYVIKKIEVNDKLYNLYAEHKFRQYKWYGYLNRNRSQNNLVNHLKNFIDGNLTLSHHNITRKNRQHRRQQRSKNSERKRNRNIQKHKNKEQFFCHRINYLTTGQSIPPHEVIPPSEQEIIDLQKKLWCLKEQINLLRKGRRRTHKSMSRKRRRRKNQSSHDKQRGTRSESRFDIPMDTPKRILIMGDWSIDKQMRHFIPTPNISLKRRIARDITVYDLDEYLTSKIHYKTEVYCKNLHLPDITGKTRKIHSVLTYQMKRLGCINRDSNGRQNIRKLFDYHLKNHSRPIKYCR